MESLPTCCWWESGSPWESASYFELNGMESFVDHCLKVSKLESWGTSQGWGGILHGALYESLVHNDELGVAQECLSCLEDTHMINMLKFTMLTETKHCHILTSN